MYIFRSTQQLSSLLRAYTFRHCYEESRVIEKSKSQSCPDAVATCLIVRKERVRNETDFGYKE